MAVVRIPDPCQVPLHQMNAVPGGKYCGDCSKVVLDFTEMSDAQILEKLRENAGKKTCGIFTHSQAIRGPKPTFELARFAAALLLVFGSLLFAASSSGCSAGEVEEIKNRDSVRKADSIQQLTDSLARDEKLNKRRVYGQTCTTYWDLENDSVQSYPPASFVVAPHSFRVTYKLNFD